jgi:Mn-containing catalase
MAPTDKETANPKLLSILEQNWHAEMDGFYAYKALADRERNPVRKSTLLHLADAERNHASLWRGRIAELGGNAPLYRGKTDAVSLLNRIGGSETALRRLEIEESRDIAKYAKQLKELGDERSITILNAVPQLACTSHRSVDENSPSPDRPTPSRSQTTGPCRLSPEHTVSQCPDDTVADFVAGPHGKLG